MTSRLDVILQFSMPPTPPSPSFTNTFFLFPLGRWMLSSWASVLESDSVHFKLDDTLEYTKKITSYHYTELVQSSYVSTANDLINARGVYSISGAKRGHLIDRRHLKETVIYSYNCNKLNKTNMLSVKISRKWNNTEYIHSINYWYVPTSMSESSLRVIVLPSLVYTWQETEWIDWFFSF